MAIVFTIHSGDFYSTCVGKYTIHGSYGYISHMFLLSPLLSSMLGS